MKYIKNNLGMLLVWALSFLPVFVWLIMSPVSERFSSSASIFRSLGQLTGLVGTVLMSVNIILSSRLKFLDKIFNGLNLVYVNHQKIGVIAFSLIIFHPIFLTVQYLTMSISAAFGFLFDFSGTSLIAGKLSLILFVILIAFTYYFSFKYQTWKNTHKFFGVVLLLAFVHVFLISSDVSRNVFLRFYILALILIAVASYFYRTVFQIYKKKEYKYELSEILEVNENVTEIKLRPLSKKMDFLPGQFVFLRFNTKGEMSESHPFSIASCKNESGELSIVIKSLGDYSSQIKKMNLGTICFIEGPFGNFNYKNATSKRQIWLAGGIGITPFLGMARQVDFEKDREYKIDLFYTVKNNAELVFDDELSNLAKNGSIVFHKNISSKDGHITADTIAKQCDTTGAEIFLCGPSGFMTSLREQFINLGLKNNQIHSEEFNF